MCHTNVHLVDLPPHTSHVLQPLDLSVFSRRQRAYGAGIEKFARFEDSAPVGKARFVQYYSKARRGGLKARPILGAWQGAGLFPWTPKKVGTESDADARDFRSSANAETALPYAPTPQNKRPRVEPHAPVSSFGNLNREVRTLFRKPGALDLLHVQNTHNEQLRPPELTN